MKPHLPSSTSKEEIFSPNSLNICFDNRFSCECKHCPICDLCKIMLASGPPCHSGLITCIIFTYEGENFKYNPESYSGIHFGIQEETTNT